jgi:hypothetical protein
MRGLGFLPGAVLSYRAVAGSGSLLGDVKPSGLDIREGVDRLCTCIIEFYTEHIAFTRIYLPYIGIIMVCMRVSLVKLPFRVVMGPIPVLECILSGACGLLLPHPILSGGECHRPSRP